MECLSAVHAFDYIALRINSCTISCRQWLVSVMLAIRSNTSRQVVVSPRTEEAAYTRI